MRIIPLMTCLLLLAGTADAADIGVVGLFPGKAVLVIDDAAPKTYAIGNTIAEGTRLVASDGNSATVEVNGKRQTLVIGQHANHTISTGPASVTLQADSRGHFLAQGQINGGTMRMLVDTGASMVALSASDALRLGIDYKNGQRITVNTANGVAAVYRIKLDSVKVGDIELRQIDAVIHETGLPYALLGMSFLNRTDMRRDGEQMTLTRRF
ncbi:TIGR02281 family clan AA aspartic protease [Undibacterium arcticum]|uniref:TIGR02281 family clan AA aspartic protease n=1 Tax=Undibacterium arcticum TaxID=1762892 RepID=A0ABV7F3H7_9BURK